MDLNPRNESGMGRRKSALSTLKGARKVWGTLRSTSTVAVSNALKLVPEIPSGSIIVKRKYKTYTRNSSNVTKWWFILRGEEEVLQLLESKWKLIAMQTAWSLEPVLYSDTSSTDTSTVASHSWELNTAVHMDNPEGSTPCVPSTPAQAKEFHHPLSGVPPQEEGITSVPTTPVQVEHLPHPLLGTPPQEEGVAPHS